MATGRSSPSGDAPGADAGAPGRLELTFAAARDGTWLRRRSSRAPLRCIRAFPIPGGERLAQVLHVGPGVMGGDRLELRICAEPRAQVVVIAQSATKLHAMHAHEHARQRVTIHVGEGASLEYHPGLTIPFAGSEFVQHVDVELAPGARFVFLERWAAGRIARAERHAYRRVESHLRVRRGAHLVYADALVLEPDDAAGPAVFDGSAYLAHGATFGSPVDATSDPLGRGGAMAVMPISDDAWTLRALGDDGVVVADAVRRHWRAWRHAAGRPDVALDRFGA